MGKKRTANKVESSSVSGGRSLMKLPKKKIMHGVIYIEATYNNIKVIFTELNGNVVMWATGGSLGFSSAKKATPYAAVKVAESISERAQAIGVKTVDIVIKGVGGGREAALRSIINRGFAVESIIDKTPVPHNGPRRPKARRV